MGDLLELIAVPLGVEHSPPCTPDTNLDHRKASFPKVHQDKDFKDDLHPLFLMGESSDNMRYLFEINDCGKNVMPMIMMSMEL